jgi:hypothetical protein
MKPSYRRAGRHTGLLVASFVLGNVVGIGAAAVLEPRIGGVAWVICVVLIVVFMAAGYLVASRKDKARWSEIGQALSRLGYRFDDAPTLQSFGNFVSLAEWGDWNEWLAKNEVKWVAVSDDHLVMERQYLHGSGEDAIESVTTTGVVLDAACTSLQGIQLVRGSENERSILTNVGPLAKTGDESFDRSWAMASSSSAPSDVAPSSAVRQALQSSPDGEFWYFWEGWAACRYEACLDAKNMLAFLSHIDRVVSLLRR